MLRYLICFLIFPTLAYAQADTLKRKERNALSPTGYTGGVQFGGLMQKSYYGGSNGSFLFQTSHGYRFNPHFAVYGIAELNFYSDAYRSYTIAPIYSNPSMYLLPVMASARYTLRKHGFTPYIAGEAGYGFELSKDSHGSYSTRYWGGLAWGGEFGLQIPTKQRTAFVLSVGYRQQSMRKQSLSTRYIYVSDTRITANRLSIKFGMTF